jgi:putative SOS response-associated peptidase YedK
MARIHNRMPVILQDDQIETWLDPSVVGSDKLRELLKAPPEDFLDCYPVDPKRVNSGLVDRPNASTIQELSIPIC